VTRLERTRRHAQIALSISATAAILLAQAVLGALAGALGIVIATPLAAAIFVLVKKVYIEGVLEGEGAANPVPQASPPGGGGQ